MQDWLAPDPVAVQARRDPQALACVDLATGRRWDYAALDAEIDRAAALLARDHGICPGQRLAVIARNSAWLLVLQQAVMRLGAVFVPLNWRLTAPELRRILEDCEPHLLFVDAARLKPGEGGPLSNQAHPIEGFIEALDRAPFDRPAYPVRQAGDPCVILYTSGTSTGRPKGAMLSAEALQTTAVNFGVLGEVDGDAVFLNDTPMFHVIGLVTSCWPAMLRGGAILFSAGFDAQATNARLADPTLRVTHYFCVPQMATMLAQAENFAPAEWRALKALFTGGAPNPPANIRWWLARGVMMVDGFGMTEVGTALGMPMRRELIDAKAGAVGIAGPATAIRIVTAEGRDAGIDEPGEILIKSPSLTSGYWRRPEEHAASFTEDGWLRTGDLARRDADGYVWIVGRAKEMYISGGENVYPAEIEAALIEHPAVLEVVVLGVPDSRWGEVGRAYLVLRPGAPVPEITPAALEQHCASRIARYKVPKDFRVVETLPRTGSGKYDKHSLRQAIRAEFGPEIGSEFGSELAGARPVLGHA